MKEIVVLFDMDNVLFDFSGALRKEYNRRYNDNLRPEEMNDWNLMNLPEPKGRLINEIWKEPGFFQKLPLLNDAAKWVPIICKEFNSYICSHVGRTSWVHENRLYSRPLFHIYAEKEHALEEHFGDLFADKIWYGKDKEMVKADVLLDDKIDTLINFQKKTGIAVCYNGYHNTYSPERSCNWHGTRVNNMEEFYHFLCDYRNERSVLEWTRRSNEL